MVAVEDGHGEAGCAQGVGERQTAQAGAGDEDTQRHISKEASFNWMVEIYASRQTGGVSTVQLNENVWYAGRVPASTSAAQGADGVEGAERAEGAERTARPASASAVHATERAERTPRGDRRAEIVSVAYRLIVERGLEGLRFADVARQAGINNGTLLYYFASKDALVQAVSGLLLEKFSQSDAPNSDGGPPDALAQLRWEFADARKRLHDDTTVVYTELLARAQRDATVAAILSDIDAHWHAWLISILERGRTEGAFRADMDTDLVASTIMAAMRGVGIQALATHKADLVEQTMDVIARLIEDWIKT
jgi:TetR/AcrR family transcriptional repressor of nem operon